MRTIGNEQTRSARLRWVALAVIVGASSLGATCTRNRAAVEWGALVAPTHGTSEAAPYAGAELLAGPGKFGPNYFAGVLPSGRFVKPAGTSLQIGMNPLGATLTPDGKFLVTSNDDERDGTLASLQNATNQGGYSLTVVDTAQWKVVSQVNGVGALFVGLVATGTGPYTLWAAGGAESTVKVFTITAEGVISTSPTRITIPAVTSATGGAVSHYTPGVALNTADASGNKPGVPSGLSRTAPAAISFPAGLALSPDGRYLFVACNGDDSLAVLDTSTQAVVKQLPVGFFPYGVQVSADGRSVYVTNWGISEYRFNAPTYDGSGNLVAVGAAAANQPDGFYVPVTDTTAGRERTSSAWVISVPNADPAAAAFSTSRYLGKPLDAHTQVGDTHPSAAALVSNANGTALYVTKSNDDALSLVAADGSSATDFDLSLELGGYGDPRVKLRGTYPNAVVASADGSRAYVAEAGINSVAVLDTTRPFAPRLLGRLPTGWYPTALALGADGKTLYVVNAKGVGEDLNPSADLGRNPTATGIESFTDGNYIFGTVQKIDLTATVPDPTTVARYNFAKQSGADTSVVPLGGAPSNRIKHVIFILQENKTFDSMLGSLEGFGPFASTTFNASDGSVAANAQFTGVAVNTQAIARAFATAVNYYSDSEESDAGHQFCASGTASDYTEKTLLVKSGRGLLVNKNFEPEDYPASGYIFNNAARHGVSFKDYGAFLRIDGTDTGTSTPVSLNDPTGQGAGYPVDNTAAGPDDVGDTTSTTRGTGQSYFLALPMLAVLGESNAGGEPHLDRNYPGYNFNISDQRRALEFIKDFDAMVARGTVPQLLYVYLPNDHTGSQQATNVTAATAAQQVADGDVGLGMVVQHLMKSPIYYDAATHTGSAIFVTYDDAQATLDHVHEHRTPAIVVSPFARKGHAGKQHYSSASIVKTEELLLGLPPNNLGDLLATDMRDLFQATYNGITWDQVGFNATVAYVPSPEGRRIWELVGRLDTSAGPDRDSARLGALGRLSMAADQLHAQAEREHRLGTSAYRRRQSRLLAMAEKLVDGPRRQNDD